MKKILLFILILSLMTAIWAKNIRIINNQPNQTTNTVSPQKLSDLQDLSTLERQSLNNKANYTNRNSLPVLLYESFEEGYPPSGWTLLDADGDGYNWRLDGGTVKTGRYSTLSVSYPNVDNYLVTPQINLPQGYIMLEYYVFLSDWHPLGENYSVMISTTTPTIGAFTEIFFENGGLWDFQERHVDLSEYAGQSVYIAFRHHSSSNRDAMVIDDITVFQQQENDLMGIRVSGQTMYSVGEQATHTVHVRNYGVTTATNYTVRLMNGNTMLATVPGVALQSLNSYSFPINWTPSSEGIMNIHGEVVWAADNNQSNNITEPISIEIKPEGTIVTFIGDVDDYYYTGNEPFDILNHSSAIMVLYYENELPESGVLTQIALRYRGSGEIQDDLPIQIYLTHTQLQNLENFERIPASQMTKVFDGTIDLSTAGEYNVMIELSQPFVYEGGNLYMLYYKPWQDGVPFWDDSWQNSMPSTNIYRTISIAINNDIINIEAWDQYYEMWGVTTIPNTMLLFANDNVGHVQGVITHNSQPAAGAIVSVDGTARTGITNSQGEYFIQYLSPGSYNLTASKVGYFDSYATNVNVFDQEYTTQNFVLQPLNSFELTGRIIASDSGLPIPYTNVRITGYADFPLITTNAQGEFTIENVYGNNNNYNLVASATGFNERWYPFVMPNDDLNLFDIMVYEIAYPPRNVIATELDDSVYLTWLRPQVASEKWFSHSVGERFNFGLPAGNYTMGHRFTPAQINEMRIAGNVLDMVSYALDSWAVVFSLTLKIYTGGSITPVYNPGNLVHVQDLGTAIPYFYDWIDVILTNPVTIPEDEELWITIEVSGENFLLCMDYGPAYAGFGDVFFYEGVWGSLFQLFGYNQNFMLRGFASVDGERSGDLRSPPHSVGNAFIRSAIRRERIYPFRNGELRSPPYTERINAFPTDVWRSEIAATGWRSEIAATPSRVLEKYNIYRAKASDINTPELWTTIATNLNVTEYTDTTWDSATPKHYYTYIVQSVYTNNNLSIPVFSNHILRIPENMDYLGDPESNIFYQVTPISVNLQTSVNQTIFLAEEFSKTGAITEIMLNFIGAGNAINGREYRIYLGYTDKDGFVHENDWVPYEDLTLVYAGELPVYEAGEYMVNITLTTPFLYGGTSNNLVLMGYSTYVPQQISGNGWKNTTGFSSIRSMFAASSVPYDDFGNKFPEAIGGDSCIPNIGFTFTDAAFGNLAGIVTDSTNGQPLSHAELVVTGTNRKTYTNDQGEYTFDYLFAGNISITVSMTGYSDLTESDIEIISGQTTTRNFELDKVVDDGELTDIPDVTALHLNFPNPFNPSTTILFDKANDGYVTIEIYNIRGQKIITLLDDVVKAGKHRIEWNGTDALGRNVASGVYFYRMKTEEYVAIRRMLLMK